MSGPRRQTKAVRAGIATETQHGAVVPPLHLSTTFSFDGLGGKRQYDYSRSGNPTRDQAAGAVADLEGGVGAVLTSSGMAAVTVVLQLLDPGDLIVAPHDCYGGTYRLLSAQARRGHFNVAFVDLTDLDALHRALAREPRMIWVETPSNPLLRITDVAEVARRARAADALVVVDNTFLSPALQRPLSLGADLVVHSTTKYLNGHSDVVGGAVVSSTADLHERIGWWANCLGLTGSPFDSYLLLRGVRTLFPRIAVHQANALAVVGLLCRHPLVRRVHHPSLADHPGHEVALRQQTGFGAMVSFEIQGGESAVRALVGALDHFTLAESLGGIESLVAHPATMTHAAMDPEARHAAGIGESLLRLSVGIEAEVDLLQDLEHALARAEAAATVVA